MLIMHIHCYLPGKPQKYSAWTILVDKITKLKIFKIKINVIVNSK